MSTISGLEEFEENLQKFDESKAEKNQWVADMLKQIRDKEQVKEQGGN